MNKRRQQDIYEQIKRASRARFNQARQTSEEIAMLFNVPFDDINGAVIADMRSAVEEMNQRFFEMSAYWNAANTARDLAFPTPQNDAEIEIC